MNAANGFNQYADIDNIHECHLGRRIRTSLILNNLISHRIVARSVQNTYTDATIGVNWKIK